ncbi:MAG: glycosyltransferase family 1 protein [Candidatus Komeilibacteria bacterium]|nr:glycosyltransferase family 1 protein [Candidatus Komeilibacteria bacterium]
MKIGVDLRAVSGKQLTGVGTYTLAVLEELLRQDKQNHYKLFCNSLADLPQAVLDRFKNSNAEIYSFHYPSKLFNGALTFFRRPCLDKLIKGADLFWFPNLSFWSVSQSCRTIVTVHDLSFKKIPWAYSAKMRLWHQLVKPRQKLASAAKIIAVSNNTKRDLMDLYNLPKEKIEAVYPGLPEAEQSSANFQAIKNKYNLPEKFILYLGTLEPRKNIEGIIAAYELLNRPDVDLVIAGGKGWLYRQIYRLAAKSPLKKQIHFINYIQPEDRFSLYRLAAALVWPSFYEGFGLPPLEAMASGVPVITSANSSLPEVVGQAALLVDPYNIAEIKEAMNQAINNPLLRAALIKKGQEQVKKYSWQQTAKQMLKIFEQYENRH